MRNAIFIQARLKSTRLEKKVLKEHKGRSVLEYQIERLKKNCNYPIFLLTSTNSQDDPLEELSRKQEVNCFRGSEEDVIERFTLCAEHNNTENFYLIFGDEPFTDILAMQETFEKLNSYKEMIVFNNHLPEGSYGYGFTQSAAKILNRKKTSFINEVWGEMAKKIGVEIFQNSSNTIYDDVRLTIDYVEDFFVFTKIIDAFNEKIFTTSTDQIIRFYIDNDLQKINGARIHDYKKRIIDQGAMGE